MKHLDSLQSLQDGKPSPVMVHVMLTNQCNIRCDTCCFSATNNDGKSLELTILKETMKQFHDLGTKAVELTGGGDPTMYPHVNETIQYLSGLNYVIGINTNGVLANRITEWDKIKWVRLSMNALDFFPTNKAHKIAHIRSFNPTPDITGCYVWGEKAEQNIERVIDYANQQKIPTRIVPNCIVDNDEIIRQLERIVDIVNTSPNNNYVFASDHNVDVGKRHTTACFVHNIKPALFTDGWIYSCPSSELSLENGITLDHKFRVCYGTDVKEFYTKNATPSLPRNCGFCKYKAQNEFLEALLTPTIHNEFC